MNIKKNIKKFPSNIKDLNSDISVKVRSFLPLQLQYIFGVYFLTLFFFFLFRLAAFAVHTFVSFSDLNPILLIRSLLIGVRFDTVVLCWILSVFLILLVIGLVFNINKKWYYRPLHILLTAVICFALVLTAAGVAHFIFFGSHINIVTLSWMQHPSNLAALVTRHPVILLYTAACLFAIAWFIWLMYCLYNTTLFLVIPPYKPIINKTRIIVSSLLVIVLCGLGMYGRITEKKPINISVAYFSDSDFFNNLGISPLFNVQESVQERYRSNNLPLAVVDGVTARSIITSQMFSRNDAAVMQPKFEERVNLCMIMLKDISYDDIDYRNMPYLSRLEDKGLSFTNVYPDGENDYNGIFSTLFAYPNIFSANSMNTGSIVPKFSGIPNVLSSANYENMFLVTKRENSYSTMRFLYCNNFSNIITPDSLETHRIISSINNSTNNFFACILTPTQSKKATDNFIKNLFTEANRSAFFNSTIFVIVGLNGKENDKIPFIIYQPKLLKAQKIDYLASQTDIAPTILTMFRGINYLNEKTYGLNILSDKREYAFSSFAHKVVVRDDGTWKYVWRDSGKESLYYKNSDKEGINYLQVSTDKAEQMKNYAFSFLQMTQFTISELRLKRN